MTTKSLRALTTGSIALVSISAFAQTGNAPCRAFQKLPNGKWSVVQAVKIENGKTSVTVNAGTIIVPGMRVTGVDIYAALEKSCLQAKQ
jgi:hypothetical protein